MGDTPTPLLTSFIMILHSSMYLSISMARGVSFSALNCSNASKK